MLAYHCSTKPCIFQLIRHTKASCIISPVLTKRKLRGSWNFYAHSLDHDILWLRPSTSKFDSGMFSAANGRPQKIRSFSNNAIPSNLLAALGSTTKHVFKKRSPFTCFLVLKKGYCHKELGQDSKVNVVYPQYRIYWLPLEQFLPYALCN